MMEFLTYDLKVAALLAVFYMFYRLLLSRETFHCVNRIVLLTTAVASFILPLCVITLHKTVVVELTEAHVDFEGMTMMIEEAEQQPFWQTAAVIAFFIGMVATLGYTLSNVLRVWLLISRSQQHPQADGTVICVTSFDVSPFSWMHYIVLSQSDYEAQDASILAHERGHIRRHHSLDLLLVDTLTALQWFNPAMWMLRQDLRAIHEYEADAAVLSQGINMRQYQYLLIQKAVSHCGYSVANGISHSTLKNRINMMLHKNSSRASLLKLLALVPIVGIALAMQAETVNDYVYTEKTQTPPKKVIKKGKANAQVKMGNKTIQVKKTEKIASGKTKEPLIMIDGKRSTKAEMDALDEKKIDHINVLKGKAATEIYGAEGKNGVIEIKTKKPVLLDVVVKTEAQTEPDDKPFDVVEQMPEFPGGKEALMKFISENVKYPKEAEEKGLQGRVVVRYVIEKDGSISEVEIAKSVNEYLDAEAIRVVNAMPKWIPGKQKGEPVRVKFTIPITFRLS
ncbi:TonB family C-terminal domain-containing protein [Prevotella communis]|uniref:TonB family C-terminal domain-containing protein n=1 Tax=Prevotella communis TaxID=2913614 RepID=A0A1H0G0H9_9BACT|nr:M56 family metallopeptidase [Prevotella communis]SDO00396.1 TonB family C-terminal domain-containing protein [Prevotella communis]